MQKLSFNDGMYCVHLFVWLCQQKAKHFRMRRRSRFSSKKPPVALTFKIRCLKELCFHTRPYYLFNWHNFFNIFRYSLNVMFTKNAPKSAMKWREMIAKCNNKVSRKFSCATNSRKTADNLLKHLTDTVYNDENISMMATVRQYTCYINGPIRCIA